MDKKLRKRLYFIRSLFTFNYNQKPCQEPIDIIIPVVYKDLRTLPLCIEGVRRCIRNKIRDIYIVASANADLEFFCADNDLKFIEEDSVLGYGVSDIHYIVNGKDNRSGWIFQQLLKLSGKIGTCENYVTVDADHILLRPHTFITKNEHFVFYQGKEFHQPYYQTNFLLVGNDRIPTLSYVAHKMVFSKSLLVDLHQVIEQHCNMSWDKAILKVLNPNQLSCFSEFELYGGFVRDDKKVLLPFQNRSLHSDCLTTYEDLVKRYGYHHRTVTFPDYLN